MKDPAAQTVTGEHFGLHAFLEMNACAHGCATYSSWQGKVGDLNASEEETGKNWRCISDTVLSYSTSHDLAEGLRGDPTVFVETSVLVKHCGQCSSKMPQSTTDSKGYSNCCTGLVSHLLSTNSSSTTCHCSPWVTNAPGSMPASCWA